jgi:transposase
MCHYLGVDFHKRSVYFALQTPSGQTIQFKRIPAQAEAVKEYLKSIPRPFKAAIEATRNWYWPYDLLEQVADEVKLSHPIKTRLIAEARIKTDKVDAQTLANLLRTDYLPTCYVPDQETRQRRELLRHRTFLIRIRNCIKNRIHTVLDKVGVEHPFENLFSKTGLEFLKNLSLPWAYQIELRDYLEILELLNRKEKEQNRLITKLCKKTSNALLLTTLPGFGYHNALLVAEEIAEVNRFPDGSHLASYCGLVTSVRISDQTVRYGHITKQGNRWLRWIYIEAAHFARKHSARFGSLYRRIAHRSGKQKAVVAVARELAVVSYYMLKYQRPFDDNKERRHLV